MKKRFSEEQIIGFLREAEAGMAVKDLCRKHGFSEASYYLWRSAFGGMTVSEAKRLKELEAENARLKKLLAESMLENEITREALRKKVVAAPAPRLLVRGMTSQGLSESRTLTVLRMSASDLRYAPAHCSHPPFSKRSTQARRGRRRQRSKPNGRDSKRAAGRSPRARWRYAGTLHLLLT